jgi:hypothetical protein
MWPRRTWSAELRSVGVSPAHEASRSADGKRPTSPISATIVAAVRRPIPGDGREPADPVVVPERRHARAVGGDDFRG